MSDVQELDASFLGNSMLVGQQVAVRGGYDYSRFALQPSNANDEDEWDEMMGEVEPGEEGHAFQGPITWEDADMFELESVMLNVTNAALLLSNKDLASRLAAAHATATENDNADPLGLGRIDCANVALVKTDEVVKEKSKSARPEFKRKGSKKSNDLMRSCVVRTMSFDVDVAELRAKAVPNGEDFNPDIFLGTIHSRTPLTDLLRGRQNLHTEVSERTGQLRALVKQNLDCFISCKDTIDDIHKRLKKSEACGTGTSSTDLVVVIAEVQEVAKGTFETLLNSADRCDQLKNVIAMIKRYDHIIQIPLRIKQGIAAGNFDQVISEYKKARTLMATVGTPKPNSLWEKLFTEVEKEIKAAVDHLEAMLNDPSSSRSSVVDSAHHILQLQVEGSPSALSSNPLLIHAQVKAEICLRNLDALELTYFTHIETARIKDEQARDTQAGGQYDQESQEEDAAPEAELAAKMPTMTGSVWAKFITELFGLGMISLPDIVLASEGRLSQSMVAGVRQKVAETAHHVGPIIVESAARFHRHVDAAMAALSKHEEDSELFSGTITHIAKNWKAFTAMGAPPPVLSMMQAHMTYACVQVIEQMKVKVRNIVEEMPFLENFEIVPSSHKAGHPASRVPVMFRNALSASLGTLEIIMNAAANDKEADDEEEEFVPLCGNESRDGACSTLRQGFCGGFSSFTSALDSLWALMVARQDPQRELGPEISSSTKLLILQSNCVNLRTHVLKELATRFQGLLTADGDQQEYRKLMGGCVEEMRILERRLANTYIKSKVKQLNEVLEDYFEEDGTDWRDAPIPTGLRDCTFDIIRFLVSVLAELYTNALALQKRATEELIQHLFQAYRHCIEDKMQGVNLGGALQLLLELQYMSHGLPVTKTQRDSLIAKTKEIILAKITVLIEDAPASDMQAFGKWCSQTGGTKASYRADEASKLRSAEIAKATCFELASFKA